MASYEEDLLLLERGLDKKALGTAPPQDGADRQEPSEGGPSSSSARKTGGERGRKKVAATGSGSGSASGSTTEASAAAAGGNPSAVGAPLQGDRKARKPASARTRVQYDDPSAVAKVKKAQILKREESSRVVPFLSHLPQYEKSLAAHGLRFKVEDSMHPALVKLGQQYAEGIIDGSSARLSALIAVFREIVEHFEITDLNETRDFRRELDKTLKKSIQFVIDCRPMSISMGNFVRELKKDISDLSPIMTIDECKSTVLKSIDRFRLESFELPFKTVVETAAERAIENGDTVVVYCKSLIVESVLLRAKQLGKAFRVMVIDSSPRFEGKQMCLSLLNAGISFDYGLINAAYYLVEDATKVLLGAHSMMSNGSLFSRIGTSLVAAACRQLRIPVIVVCPTVKFSERVQLDALCFNELGDPDELLSAYGSERGLSATNWREASNLHVLNLSYDLVPGDYIDAVVTEVGVIPASSVPVVVHDYFRAS